MHLYPRAITIVVALATTVALAPHAVAETAGPGPIKYAPLSQVIRPGILRPGAVRHHTLAIQPVYSKSLPDATAMRAMATATKKFWESEIPGMTINVRYLKPVRFAGACARTNNRSEIVARKVAPINPYQTGNHLVTYVPECGFSNGWGSRRNGSGTIFIGNGDSNGSMLTHEFGHNLGLLHADLLDCRQAGSAVSLAKSCTEIEYGNDLQVMGNAPLWSSTRVGPFAQSLLTARAKTIDPRRGGAVTLAAGRAGQQAAQLKTPLGVLYLGAIRGPDAARTASLVVEVATRNGSGLVQYPEVADLRDTYRGTLALGNVWEVPGTSLRVVVTHATPADLTVSVTPRGEAGAAPAPAVVTLPPNGQFPDGIAWRLSWTPSPSKDVVAYLVRAGTAVVARVNGDQSSAAMPTSVPTEWVGNHDTGEGSEIATLSVEAISRSGLSSTSAPITVVPVASSVSLTSSLGPAESPIAAAPFTLTWAIDAVHAGSVAKWEVTYAGTTTTLPADQTSLVIDPALNDDPEYGDVEVSALDSTGHSVGQEYYTFYTPLWASENA